MAHKALSGICNYHTRHANRAALATTPWFVIQYRMGWSDAMLCDAILCYTMLYYAMLCYAILYYTMRCYAILCDAMLYYYTMRCYAILYYAMLCYTMLYYTMLCYTMLYYAMLCCIVLYCAVLCYAVLCSLFTHFLITNHTGCARDLKVHDAYDDCCLRGSALLQAVSPIPGRGAYMID